VQGASRASRQARLVPRLTLFPHAVCPHGPQLAWWRFARPPQTPTQPISSRISRARAMFVPEHTHRGASHHPSLRHRPATRNQGAQNELCAV
jgi:hypothetical protein